jgi:hypothetical protein
MRMGGLLEKMVKHCLLAGMGVFLGRMERRCRMERTGKGWDQGLGDRR